MFRDQKLPRPSGLTCPITGSPLLLISEEDMWTLDGESRYAAESDPAITYSHSGRPSYFKLTSGYPLRRTKIPYTNDPARYFEIDEDNKWQEFYRLTGRHELVKIDTPFEEVEELLKKLRAEDAERRAKWRDGPNLLPLAKQVAASTFSNDLISVQPMSEPTGKLQEFRTRLDHSTLEYREGKLKSTRKKLADPKFLNGAHPKVIELLTNEVIRLETELTTPPAPDPLEYLLSQAGDDPKTKSARSIPYLEYTYVSSEVPITYPYLVTQDNLKQTQANFKTDDVVIGDTVDEWDTGGWLQLAGRAGEHIVRNGKVVHTRLTRMS